MGFNPWPPVGPRTRVLEYLRTQLTITKDIPRGRSCNTGAIVFTIGDLSDKTED